MVHPQFRTPVAVRSRDTDVVLQDEIDRRECHMPLQGDHQFRVIIFVEVSGNRGQTGSGIIGHFQLSWPGEVTGDQSERLIARSQAIGIYDREVNLVSACEVHDCVNSTLHV